eukprot:COSAG02_NODE_1936_length_10314_cov_6.250024_2_plen_190_part_00
MCRWRGRATVDDTQYIMEPEHHHDTSAAGCSDSPATSSRPMFAATPAAPGVAAPTKVSSAWAVQQCSICLLDVLEEQHHAYAHPESGCTHKFHWPCLADSLALSSQCPNCRRPYHDLGVFEVLAHDGGCKHHIPDLRVRESQPTGAGGAAGQGGLLQRFCQSRMALPVIITILASPIGATFCIKMARDT